jgi:hypothetical protein
VPVEEQVLPHADLKPLYDRVVWVWVYRDFTKGASDLAAERIMNRFGVSSYPQLIFSDSSGRVLVEPARSVASMLASAKAAAEGMPGPLKGLEPLELKMKAARELLDAGRKVEARKALKALTAEKDDGEFYVEARRLLRSIDPDAAQLSDPDFERRADALDGLLEKQGTAAFQKEALGLLRDPDADVRMRAVRYVARAAPEELAGRIGDLLADPMDSVKFAALDAAQGSQDPKLGARLAEAWRSLDEKKLSSKNPNVLRGRIAAALGDSGTAEAVPLLGAFAARHEFFNSTTGLCVSALGRIGKRLGARLVADALLQAFPPAAGPEEGKTAPHRARLARSVHDALVLTTAEGSIEFPKGWSQAEAEATVAAWRRRLALK